MEEVLHTIRLWYYYYNTYLLLNSEENIYICYSSQVLIWLGKMYKCLKRAIPSRKCYIIYCSSLTKRSAIKEEINDLGPKFIFQRFFLSPLVHGVVRQCSTKAHCPFNPCSVRTNENNYTIKVCCCNQDFCNTATYFGMNLF